MKVYQLLENEWENNPIGDAEVLNNLRRKKQSLYHRRQVMQDRYVILQDKNIARASLNKDDPDASDSYRRDAEQLTTLIRKLDQEIAKITNQEKKATLNMRYARHDARLALIHARALNKPYPEGEDAIAKDPESAFKYAMHVLHKRFLKGEPAIARVQELRSSYRATFGTINYEYKNESK